MIKIKIASLAISLTMLATAANGQSAVQYSESQGYGYDTEPLYPYAPPQRVTPRTIIVREKPIVRTMRAEAEITILGPDSMNIRLYRKQAGRAKRSAKAETKIKMR